MNSINPMNANPRTNGSWGPEELTRSKNANATKKGGAGILEERSGLSVDDFLKIMAAEMQNQNPMGDSGGGGSSKTDYVSQLAQFTSLELMSEVVENLNYVNVMSQQQYAFSLIGKDVSIMTNETDSRGNVIRDENGNIKTKEAIGRVDKVKFKDGFPMVSVDGEDYHLSNIMEVGASGSLDKTQEDSENPTDPDEKVGG